MPRAWRCSTFPIACTRSPNWPIECTVFRNGRNVDELSRPARAADGEIVEMMIGREYSSAFPPKPARAEPIRPAALLRCRNLCWGDSLRGISLHRRRGEVVGLGGLDGQGQRELLLALFGVLRGMTRLGHWSTAKPGARHQPGSGTLKAYRPWP